MTTKTPPTIHFIITGGTIDDLDYASEEKAPKNHQSLIPNLLKQARISLDYNFEVLMQKDSRVISDKDREIILNRCRDSKEIKIIITHGTATMPLTAQFLEKADLKKTIVLFGAAIPANKARSDALFNLGTAISAVQLLPAGIYITMNGKIFPADNVKKNLATGYFEELSKLN